MEEEDLAQLFRSVSLAVLPYSSSAGASGVVHLACEYEVPVLASSITDLHELAAFEDLWLEFFPPGNVTALTEQLVRLLSDARMRGQMATHNRDAVRGLSLRAVVGEYLRIFADGQR